MGRSRWMGAASLCAAIALWTAGCGEPEPRPVTGLAPRLEPPPPAPGSLTRADVLEISRRAADARDAIQAIDARPLAFPLDQQNLDALGEEGIDPDVLSYLQRRSKVDWESLRGDIPDPPPERE